jgi:hypothetical protein
MTEGFDVGLEMSGAAVAFRDMIDTMNNGGKIAILGIAPTGFEIDWNKVIFKMLHAQGHLWPRDVRDLVQDDRLVQGRSIVSGLITHRIGIDDYQAGLRGHAQRAIPARSSWIGRGDWQGVPWKVFSLSGEKFEQSAVASRSPDLLLKRALRPGTNDAPSHTHPYCPA